MAKNKKAYLRDFTPTVGGGYAYTGPMVQCLNPPAERGRLLTALTLLGAAPAVSVALTGLVPVPGMGDTFYVILPWLGEMIAAVLLCWCGRVLPTLRNTGALRRYQYDAAAPKVVLRAGAAGVYAVLAAAGETVFLLRHGAGGHAGGAVLFYLCQACAAAAMWGLRTVLARLRFDAPPPAPQSAE